MTKAPEIKEQEISYISELEKDAVPPNIIFKFSNEKAFSTYFEEDTPIDVIKAFVSKDHSLKSVKFIIQKRQIQNPINSNKYDYEFTDNTQVTQEKNQDVLSEKPNMYPQVPDFINHKLDISPNPQNDAILAPQKPFNPKQPNKKYVNSSEPPSIIQKIANTPTIKRPSASSSRNGNPISVVESKRGKPKGTATQRSLSHPVSQKPLGDNKVKDNTENKTLIERARLDDSYSRNKEIDINKSVSKREVTNRQYKIKKNDKDKSQLAIDSSQDKNVKTDDPITEIAEGLTTTHHAVANKKEIAKKETSRSHRPTSRHNNDLPNKSKPKDRLNSKNKVDDKQKDQVIDKQKDRLNSKNKVDDKQKDRLIDKQKDQVIDKLKNKGETDKDEIRVKNKSRKKFENEVTGQNEGENEVTGQNEGENETIPLEVKQINANETKTPNSKVAPNPEQPVTKNRDEPEMSHENQNQDGTQNISDSQQEEEEVVNQGENDSHEQEPVSNDESKEQPDILNQGFSKIPDNMIDYPLLPNVGDLINNQQQNSSVQQQNPSVQQQNPSVQQQNPSVQQQNPSVQQQNPSVQQQNSSVQQQNESEQQYPGGEEPSPVKPPKEERKSRRPLSNQREKAGESIQVNLESNSTLKDLISQGYSYKEGDVIYIDFEEEDKKAEKGKIETKVNQNATKEVLFIPFIYNGKAKADENEEEQENQNQQENGKNTELLRFEAEKIPLETINEKPITTIRSQLEIRFNSSHQPVLPFTGKINFKISKKSVRPTTTKKVNEVNKEYTTILISDKYKILEDKVYEIYNGQLEPKVAKFDPNISKVYVFYVKSSIMNTYENAESYEAKCVELAEKEAVDVTSIKIIDLYNHEKSITEININKCKIDLNQFKVCDLNQMVQNSINKDVDDFSLFAERDDSTVFLFDENEIVQSIINETGSAEFLYAEVRNKKNMLPRMLRNFKSIANGSMDDEQLNRIYIHSGRVSDITISTIQFYA